MNKLNEKQFIFDIEADGLLDTATKIHCLSIGWIDNNGIFQVKSTADYDEMRKFFSSKFIKIGHNIINYDNRAVEKLLGCVVDDDTVIDTLALSWYLFPTLLKHGLEEWGQFFGIKKPEIKDWSTLPVEEYMHRCEEDVKINFKLWRKELKELGLIYDQDKDEMERLIDYLQFKMFCVSEQVKNPVKFDVITAMSFLDSLKAEKEAKYDALAKVMPKIEVKTSKKYKDAIVVSENEFYQKGDLMYDYYLGMGYKPEEVSIDIHKKFNEPNPNSTEQKKDWLYSLGWEPTTFQYKKEKDGKQRKIPQIMSDKKDGTVCPSVAKLFEKEPKLELLEGYSILSHRIGLVEGLLESQKDGYIQGSMTGFTNTLRLKHKGLVNLPGVSKKYGDEIRSLFIAEEGDLLCGSDCSGLEDNCKQHYMYPYDPKYIDEMRTPGFDAHLDIGMLANLITTEEADFYKWYDKQSEDKSWKPTKEEKENYTKTKKKRFISKTVNFASVYGAGAAKIALSGGLTLKEAKLLHKIYWQRNKAVKQVAEAFIVKEINNQKWLFNPVSKLWYSLRAEKDRFSTGNQGLGVWCFDTWVKNVRKRGIVVNYQCHDEILFRLNGRTKEEVTEILKDAMDETNKIINLNVPLAISIDFGTTYSNCH